MKSLQSLFLLGGGGAEISTTKKKNLPPKTKKGGPFSGPIFGPAYKTFQRRGVQKTDPLFQNWAGRVQNLFLVPPTTRVGGEKDEGVRVWGVKG